MTAKFGVRNSIVTAVVFIVAFVALSASPVAAKEYDISAYAIDLELTDEGDYVITERITYNFIEGTFTTANRQVPGRGFTSLRFIGVEGVDVPVEAVSFKDGRNLAVDWTYPETNDEATFVIRYEATGGLQSKDGANVIDWNPVGSDWTVPLRDIDVTVTLPEAVASIEALPPENVVPASPAGAASATRHVRFHRDQLPPRTFYHVVLTFPEIIPVEPPPAVGRWILLGTLVGIVLMMLDIGPQLSNKPRPAPTGPAPADFSFVEMAVLAFSSELERRRGIVATIFALAQTGHLRLTVQPKRSAFRTDQVHADVVTAADLSEAERLIVEALARRKTLQKFAYETGTFRKILHEARQSLQMKGLFSKEQQTKQLRTVLTGIPFVLLSTGGFVYFALNAGQPFWLAASIALMLQGVGRFVRGALITTLSPQGLYARQAIKSLLDEKMDHIDDLMRYEVTEAWDKLFADLPYLTMHEKFTARKLGQLKREFRRMDRVQPPEWIGYDTDTVGKTIDAISAAESVNYAFLVVMTTARSTGATGVAGGGGVSGVGAAGSGAGGGGGGAG